MRTFILFIVAASAYAQTTLGLFENQSDIGTLSHPGGAEFDSASKTYTLTSSGENMWAAEDDFHYVWKKVSGDVSLTADIAFPTTTGNAHKKGALMIRRTLDQDSDYVDAALHLAGLTSIQSRSEKGGVTREVQSYISSPKRMRLVKTGNNVFMYVAGADGVFHFSGGSMRLALDGSFYIGLAACAHDKDGVEKVTFSNIELAAGPPAGKTLYSTLEAQTSDRRAIWVEAGRIEAPHFDADGKNIVFSAGGTLRQIVATSGNSPSPLASEPSAVEAPAGPFSYYASGGQIWRKSADGGQAEQLTSDAFDNSNPHVSPDGKVVAFTARDKSGLQIHTITLATKALKINGILPDGGELGPAPWSPDSKTLTWVSYQYPPQ